MLTVETDRGFQQTSIDSLPAVVIHNYTCHDTCTGILPNDVDAHRRRMHSPAPSNMTQRALSTLHLAKRADSSLFMHIPAEGEGDTRTCFSRQTAQGTENPRRHRPPHTQPAPPCMLPTLPSLGCMCNAGGSQLTASTPSGASWGTLCRATVLTAACVGPLPWNLKGPLRRKHSTWWLPQWGGGLHAMHAERRHSTRQRTGELPPRHPWTARLLLHHAGLLLHHMQHRRRVCSRSR